MLCQVSEQFPADSSGLNASSPLRRLAHGDTLALEILTQPGIEFGQTTELEVGHALLILLDRSRVADLAGSVLRHLGRRGGGNACGRGVGVALSRENGF